MAIQVEVVAANRNDHEQRNNNDNNRSFALHEGHCTPYIGAASRTCRAGWQKADEWELRESWDIAKDEIAQLIRTATQQSDSAG